MTRDEIIMHVTAIIADKVEGTAVYYSTSPPGSSIALDYPVELDADSVKRAAEGIADFLNDFVRDEDR